MSTVVRDAACRDAAQCAAVFFSLFFFCQFFLYSAHIALLVTTSMSNGIELNGMELGEGRNTKAEELRWESWPRSDLPGHLDVDDCDLSKPTLSFDRLLPRNQRDCGCIHIFVYIHIYMIESLKPFECCSFFFVHVDVYIYIYFIYLVISIERGAVNRWCWRRELMVRKEVYTNCDCGCDCGMLLLLSSDDEDNDASWCFVFFLLAWQPLSRNVWNRFITWFLSVSRGGGRRKKYRALSAFVAAVICCVCLVFVFDFAECN